MLDDTKGYSINQSIDDEEVVLITDKSDEKDRNDSFLSIFYKMSSIALPMALSYTTSFEVFASGLLISNISNDVKNKAAVTIVSTFMNTTIIAGISPLFSMAVLLSNRLGELRAYNERSDRNEQELELKKQRISAIGRSALIISSALVTPMFLALFFSKEIATNMFGQDSESAEIAKKYLQTYAFAVPGVLLRMVFEQIMFTQQKAKEAAVIGLGTFTIGTLISVWLGFGGLGAPKMGPQGIALGYLIEAYMIAIAYGIFVFKNKDLANFSFFKFSGYKKEATEGVTKHLLSLSAPISVTIINELITTFIIGIIGGRLGSESQASLAYLLEFIFLMFIPLAAFGIASQQEVGREVGANCFKYASKLARYSLVVNLIYIIPPVLLVSAYPKILPLALGKTSDSILNKLTILAPIMASGVILDAARYTILQELRSLADNWTSTGISMLGLWMGLILAGLLSNFTPLDIYGVGIGYTAGIGIAALGLLPRWFARTQEENIITASEEMRSPPSFSDAISTLFCCKGKQNDQSKYEKFNTDNNSLFDGNEAKSSV